MTAGRSSRALLPFHLCALDYALDLIGIDETEGSNRGPSVELMLRAGGQHPGAPWCATYVNYCAECAQVLKNERSPLELVPNQALVQSYYEYGRAVGWTIDAKDAGPGDLFLLWYQSRGRYAHMGFVYQMDFASFVTVEGNTNDEATREGVKVAQRIRELNDAACFLRWV